MSFNETVLEPTASETSQNDLAVTKRRSRWFFLLLPLLLIGGVYGANEFMVGQDLQAVTSAPGNDVVNASAHYRYWVDPSMIVFDIRGTSGASKLDVFRVFLQFAEKQQNHHYSKVWLCSKGEERFSIEGSYFQQLGTGYSVENPMYTLRTFPAHVTTARGLQPYGEYEGGMLAVMSKEMEQFGDFMDEWLQ